MWELLTRPDVYLVRFTECRAKRSEGRRHEVSPYPTGLSFKNVGRMTVSEIKELLDSRARRWNENEAMAEELKQLRYHYEKPAIYLSMYGISYECDHPVYDSCTLYLIDNKGLAVIQQQYDSLTKNTWWGEIDPWLTDSLYLHPKFKEFFDSRAGECKDGLYPTVTLRQIMWALKMKPVKRERWETCFDRRDI